jgi:hypothetical protein
MNTLDLVWANIWRNMSRWAPKNEQEARDQLDAARAYLDRVAEQEDADEKRTQREFFAALPLGSVEHYDQGHGVYVRCVVVEGGMLRSQRIVTWSDNENVNELARRQWGSEGHEFQPHRSNLYRPGKLPNGYPKLPEVDPTKIP